MKKCFPASDFIKSPPFTEDQRRRMLGLIGAMAEAVIGRDYLHNEVRRPDWAPLPPALDFHDANKGFSSKTQYLTFIVNHNPAVDERRLKQMLDRAIPGPDGQIIFIPDFMSEAAPQKHRFYEVKPDSRDGTKEADIKMASLHAFMQAFGLPYQPGESWRPDRNMPFFTGLMFGMMVTVSFHYERHKQIQGVVVYHFCIDLKTFVPVWLLLLILVIIIVVILFPEIPIPDLPIPKPLPPTNPVPIPVPPRPIPVPVPAFQKPATYGICQAALHGSVGLGGTNRPRDIAVVQLLLNGWMEASKQPLLAIDGAFGPKTISAIKSFQREYVPSLEDGRIDVGGPTLFHLGEMTLEQTMRNVKPEGVVSGYLYRPLRDPGYDLRTLLWKLIETGE